MLKVYVLSYLPTYSPTDLPGFVIYLKNFMFTVVLLGLL